MRNVEKCANQDSWLRDDIGIDVLEWSEWEQRKRSPNLGKIFQESSREVGLMNEENEPNVLIIRVWFENRF